jgi:hypothetical protein
MRLTNYFLLQKRQLLVLKLKNTDFDRTEIRTRYIDSVSLFSNQDNFAHGTRFQKVMQPLPIGRRHGFRRLPMDGAMFPLPNVPAIVAASEQTGKAMQKGHFWRRDDAPNRLSP